MKLVVGLGNPGKEYEKTRHNIGFNVLNLYLKKHSINLDKDKFNGKYAKTNINGEEVIFLEPQTYMNASGDCVRKVVDFYKIKHEDILIIQDDLDMEIGKIKLKEKSSSGGHNGIKDIELKLGTNDIKRLKIGISNNKMMDTKDYVLGKFNKDDQEILEKSYEICLNIIDDFLTMNFDLLMGKYNKR